MCKCDLFALFADMAELADAPDLGSGGRPCRFDSCYPHESYKPCTGVHKKPGLCLHKSRFFYVHLYTATAVGQTMRASFVCMAYNFPAPAVGQMSPKAAFVCRAYSFRAPAVGQTMRASFVCMACNFRAHARPQNGKLA